MKFRNTDFKRIFNGVSVRSVLMSGAGITGPTLAYWLRRRGFTPTVVEREPRFREGGYMIDFWGLASMWPSE